MITYVIIEMINSITEQFKDMRSNIVNIQEKENNREYKHGFWRKVPMILFSILSIVLIIVLISLIAYSLFTPEGLEIILPIIVVDITIYVLFKIEVFYKLLYKLFKKDNKENNK